MKQEVNPKETCRTQAFELWMNKNRRVFADDAGYRKDLASLRAEGSLVA